MAHEAYTGCALPPDFRDRDFSAAIEAWELGQPTPQDLWAVDADIYDGGGGEDTEDEELGDGGFEPPALFDEGRDPDDDTAHVVLL